MHVKAFLLVIGIGALFWDDIAKAFANSKKAEKKLTGKAQPQENNKVQKPNGDPGGDPGGDPQGETET